MSRRIRIAFAALAVATLPHAINAQQATDTRAGLKVTQDAVKGYVLKAVAQIPEDQYSFKPTPEVRSMGQLLGHIAEGNFLLCAMATGEKPSVPQGTYEKLTTRAAMTKALTDAFEYCDKSWTTIAGQKGNEAVDIFGMKHTRASAMAFNASHNWEHYGNLVTYMRMKGMVPPSSQGGGGN